MLIPHRADPNYASEMERYRKDSGSWGLDATKCDMLKGNHIERVRKPEMTVPAKLTLSGMRK